MHRQVRQSSEEQADCEFAQVDGNDVQQVGRVDQLRGTSVDKRRAQVKICIYLFDSTDGAGSKILILDTQALIHGL